MNPTPEKPTPLRSLHALLTTDQRLRLHELEQAIFHTEGEVPAAIEAMHAEEKRLGVYDPRNTETPRWPKP